MTEKKKTHFRPSVIKAILGLAMILLTLWLVMSGHKGMGIFGLIPIVIGAMLTRQYFQEIGFK